MNTPWPLFPLSLARAENQKTRLRLQDLDARMSSFLSEKQSTDTACAQVVSNVRAARMRVQNEIDTHAEK